MNDLEEQRVMVTMATVRGHRIENNRCMLCTMPLKQALSAVERDCIGIPTYPAQNGNGNKSIYVYVSGPLTTGQLTRNVRDACGYASALFNKGYAVYLPHASVLWEIVHPATYEMWLAHDFLWVARCDCVFRFPGKSIGADLEVEHATKSGVPVFYDLDNLYVAQPVEG